MFIRQWMAVTALAFVIVSFVSADDVPVPPDPPEPNPFVRTGFLIIKSTKSYHEAERVVRKAAKQLSIRVDLRGLTFDPKHGLTWQETWCKSDPGGSFPCYSPRGRFDDGVYLSIERSESYETFEPGYYIVVAASGAPSSDDMLSVLSKARTKYPDAYVKSEDVYLGCMQ